MKTKAAIFLNGAYPPDHSYFYKHECQTARKDSIVIVTDGGLQFFVINGLAPDLIIGDWDSTDISRLKNYPKAVTISVPGDGKMSTDGEIALDWCVKNDIEEVVIYGGVDAVFETDHLLGNIFMMFHYKNKFTSILMRDYCQEIVPLLDESYAGIGKPDDMISIVPLSEEISYTGDGLKYDPAGATYTFGQSTPLRNQLTESVFSIELKGKAALVRHF
jgi:thiamine pyrophosphokinase